MRPSPATSSALVVYHAADADFGIDAIVDEWATGESHTAGPASFKGLGCSPANSIPRRCPSASSGATGSTSRSVVFFRMGEPDWVGAAPLPVSPLLTGGV